MRQLTSKFTISFFILFCAIGFAFAESSNEPKPQDRFAINQMGYRPDDTKDFRVTSEYSGFQILDENKKVVFSGILTGPIFDDYANEKVWKGDFSALKTPGKYTVQLSGNMFSWPFEIGDKIYDKLFPVVTNGLYASRCGYEVKTEAFTHPPCHLNQADTLLLDGKKIYVAKGGNGGWHDGGDYWRSSMSATQTISRMLWPLDLFPGKFDRFPSLLLPAEQWGGRTDILTEIKWGLDWLFQLQFDDGGVSTGISPAVYEMPPFTTAPQNDPLHHYLGAANSSHTAKAGAVFARVARILKSYDPDLAAECLVRASRCWQFLQLNPKMVNPKTIQVYGRNVDEDDRLWIAVELYRTTGEEIYHNDFLKRFGQMDNPYPKAPVNTQTIRDYNLHEALISYCFIKAGADKIVQKKIIDGLTGECTRVVAISENEGYGSVLARENWQQRHTIGNSLQISWELAMAYELTGIKVFQEVAIRQMHIVLGANPLGKVFITEVGSNPVRNPHYRPFSINNMAPAGLTVKGPTHDRQFVEKIFDNNPPPPLKAYVDVTHAHWCNEPDIEVQGHLIGLAAYFCAANLAH